MRQPDRARLRTLIHAAIALAVAAATFAGGTPAGKQAQAAAAPLPSPTPVTADFSANGGPGHAEVFGSSINVPSLTDPSKIETLHQSGTRFIRGDAYLYQILPDTTIPAYLQAMRTNSGVADPRNWDWSSYAWIDEHYKRGSKTILILAYSTQWLGYTPGPVEENFFSPPRGADGYRVYEDVIRKIYRHFEGKIDRIEVWNEPDLPHFLNLTGSPYPDTQAGRIAAYTDIYETAARAVLSVDHDIAIGGPAMADPNAGLAWVDKLLHEPRIKRDIDFLSFHSYNDYTSFRDEYVTTWKQAAKRAGKGNDFPVYVTEWNYSPSYGDVPMNANHPYSISYTASRLTQFYKQHTNGTNYFADNDESLVPQFFGVHRNGMLPPKARTYRLMSVDLGLGAGDSTLRPVTFTAPVSNAGAATTAEGAQVAWVVNDSEAPIEVDLRLGGLRSAASTYANLFEASPIQPASSPKASMPLQVRSGRASLRFGIPAKSLIGVRLSASPIADGDNLAATARVTPTSSAGPAFAGANVADGTIGVDGAGEWASNRELTPRIRLAWQHPRTVGQVVLYDRANPTDRINAGRLEFSDGSVVDVPALPNDGTTGKAVSFVPRTVEWLRFVVTNGAGANVGLSELQVYAGDNVARDGTVTTSSQADLYAHGQLQATDGDLEDEWVSTQANPWIQVRWVNSQLVDRVVLSDRASRRSNVRSGILSFSDGSQVAVGEVPSDGSAKVVSFLPRAVTWIRFRITGGRSADSGLAELRVLTHGNLASSAVATASSTSTAAPSLVPSAATDGVVNQWFEGEWASQQELDPWLRLTWTTPQRLGEVVLYDRNNLTDLAPGGRLVFSDGSQVAVSGIDNTGVGKPVSFPARTVSWVEFQVAGGSGLNVGLSEIEAYSSSGPRIR